MSSEIYLKNRLNVDDVNTVKDFPLYFEIETVNACNARCPMCTIDDWQRKSPSMKMDLFYTIADQIGAHASSVRRVSLYRDGEPLLDKKLEMKTRYLRDLGISEVAIATNAELLHPERARSILESGMNLIIVSFDSLYKPVFEKIRARLNFETCLKNTIDLIRIRNEIGSDCKIWIRMIRQDQNVDEWPFYFKFFSSLVSEMDRVYFHDIFNWGGQLDIGGMTDEVVNNQKNKPCVSLWSLMVIFSDGSVPLCNIDYNNRHKMGSVLEDSLENIWKGRSFEEKRKLHLNGCRESIDLCSDCNVWDDSYLESAGESSTQPSASGKLIEVVEL